VNSKGRDPGIGRRTPIQRVEVLGENAKCVGGTITSLGLSENRVDELEMITGMEFYERRLLGSSQNRFSDKSRPDLLEP
jgi:hypothetical protein